MHGVVDQLDRLDDLGHQLQLARLDLRHVEQLSRDVEQPVAAVLNARYQCFLFVVERTQPVVAEQLEAHQDRRNGRLHLVRDGGDEIRFRRIQLLVARHVVQDDHVADELLPLPADRNDMERDVLHLEIALLVVGVDLQRLLLSFVLLRFGVELADQPPQQIVVQSHLRGLAADHFAALQIQDRARLVVHEKDVALRIQSDDRFVEAVHDPLDAFLFDHERIERTAAVFREFAGHVVERLGHLAELAVAPEVEPLLVVVVGDLRDAPLELVDRAQDHRRELHEEGCGEHYAEDRHDRQPPHGVGRTRLHLGTFHADRSHVEIHDPVEVAADEPYPVRSHRVREGRDAAAERRRGLALVHLRDVLPLQAEAADERRPRRGILREAVQRPEHLLGVMHRVVVVRENVPGRGGELPHVTDGESSEQQNQDEQHADSQCQSVS